MPAPMATPPPLPPRVRSVELQPGFLRAAQGIWLLTWRSQFTWRRLPIHLATLLAIPLLACFTIERLGAWTSRHDWRVEPLQQVNEFKRRAVSARVPLQRGIGTQMTQIIAAEQGRVEPPRPSAMTAQGPRFSEEVLARQIEQVRSCQERIRERVRVLLEPRQLEVFDQFQESQLGEATEVIRTFNLQNVRPFYRWLIDFYFLLALPLYCLAVCGAMIRDELQADTLAFLCTRPVGRGHLFLIKYGCQMVWLQGMVVVHGMLLFGVGWLRGVPGVESVWAQFFAAQIPAVLAWGALSALLGLITRRYLVLGIVYGFVVELGLGHIPTNINSLSLTRHLQGLLGQNPFLNELYEWPEAGVWFSLGMLVVAVVVFLGAGTALFTFREYHHATEMQK